MANYNNEDGVWRTIGGRRVFIRNGQSLSEAMKESGKFKKKKLTEEEKGKKINETMDKRAKIVDKLEEDTKDLNEYDKYNLAVSKLENTSQMQPTERQYWVGIKERYEKDQSTKSSKDFKSDRLKYVQDKDKEMQKKYEELKKSGFSNEEATKISLKDRYNKSTDELSKSKNENYRNKITDVAKNSKEDNITLDVETGKPVNFEKGYSVSFQQSTDDYTDEEYSLKVKECMNKCDGKVYAGKYGGDAEASFHTDNLDDAKELMYKYNQESIYDWEHETLIMNDKYDVSKNRTNYKEEKTTNEIMNEKIRSKGKKEIKEDLPKHVEIKEQGTSNRKEVSENIQAHILEYYSEDYTGEKISPSEAFVRQMDAMREPTMWKAGQRIAEGGSYLVYNQDMADFLDSLKINPKGKKFSEDKAFDVYTNLVGRESAKLYDRIKKNEYRKYLKAHPNSDMSFYDFKNMRKGD